MAKTVRREALPRPDQDTCFYSFQSHGGYSKDRRWTKLFVFDDTESVRSRLAAMMKRNLFKSAVGWHVDHNLVFWQQHAGVNEEEVHHTLPFWLNPRFHELHAPALPDMQNSERAWPVFLSADGVEDNVCDRCPNEAAMFCRSRGGVRNVLKIVRTEKANLLQDCLYTPASVAHAQQEAIAHWSQNSPGFMTDGLKGMIQSMARGEEWHDTMLKKEGFWVSERRECFQYGMGLENDVTAEELHAVDKLIAQGVWSMDAQDAIAAMAKEGIKFKSGDLARMGRDWERNAPMIGQMVMEPEHVRRAIVVGFLARCERTIELRQVAEVRKTFCGPCVYKCPYPRDCTLTDYAARSLMSTIKSDRNLQLWWMALFAASGKRMRYGRKSQNMVWGPEDETCTAMSPEQNRFLVRNLRPPYQVVASLTVEEIPDFSFTEISATYDRLGRLAWPEAARLYFALRQLWRYAHPRQRPKFSRGKKGDKKRPGSNHQTVENDVLSICLDFRHLGQLPVIIVGSDTCAHEHGGRNRERKRFDHEKGKWVKIPSDPITPDQRPRFETEYAHPYYQDILAWTGSPLGSKKAYQGLTVVDGDRQEPSEGHGPAGEDGGRRQEEETQTQDQGAEA